MPATPPDRPEPPAQEGEGVGAGGAGRPGRPLKASPGVDRRSFLKGGIAASTLLVGGGVAAELASEGSENGAGGAGGSLFGPGRFRAGPGPYRSGLGDTDDAAHPSGGLGRHSRRTRPLRVRHHPAKDSPNVLVVMVDQMRTSPHWIPNAPILPSSLPNLTRLSRESVRFESHYTAANDCTPSRACLVTGLYTHQTGCMITGGSTLAPDFPTWGSMMREQGYRTFWYGKWHLTHGDNLWSSPHDDNALEPYGFAGGTYPSPNGAPGQGTRIDPYIADQFEEWFSREGRRGPWCTTVSFVNPHDIAWWYKWTNRVPPEWRAPAVTRRLPPNYETREQIQQYKPRLQTSLQDTAAVSFGPVPFEGQDVREAWLPFLDLYMKLQTRVDAQIGRVLESLESDPDVARNTVILFTSDHGEYGASHGLRGKGAGAYEEAIRIPLLVKDPRGKLTKAIDTPRRQLTSSVDVAPLLLTIAAGSNRWRKEPGYEHLARRADLARLLRNPRAPGRRYAVYTTDEVVTEYAVEPYASYAPIHVTAIRTPKAKFVSYVNWSQTLQAASSGEENELYDLSTPDGRLELANTVGKSPLEAGLRYLLSRAVEEELRQPLPGWLAHASRKGFLNYSTIAEKAAIKSTFKRLRNARREASIPEWTHYDEFELHERGSFWERGVFPRR